MFLSLTVLYMILPGITEIIPTWDCDPPCCPGTRGRIAGENWRFVQKKKIDCNSLSYYMLYVPALAAAKELGNLGSKKNILLLLL